MISNNAMILAVTRTSDLAPVFQAPVEAPGIPWWVYAVAVSVVAGLVAVYASMARMRVPSLCVTDDLTLELCRAHKIGVQHRAVLDHIAKLANVEHTAELFLSKKSFEAAVKDANEVKRLRGGQRGLLFEARECIFG